MTCYTCFLLLFLLQRSIPIQSELAITGNGTYQIAVGATALYSANYIRVTTSTIEILNWRINTINKIQVYIAGDGTSTIYNLDSDLHLQASAIPDASVYILSLNITDIQLTYSGVVDIFRDTPSAGLLNSFASLNVQECDSTSEGDKANINIEELVSSTYNEKVIVSCSDGYTGVVTMTCLENATWSRLGACSEATTALVEIKTTDGTEETTTTVDPTDIIPGPMSGGDVAGTVLTCIFILECICLCVLVFALNYPLSNYLIGLYVAGICLSIIGIFMCFFGSSTAGTVMNSVEIAGTVLGSMGITVMLVGIGMHAVQGGGPEE